MGPLEAADRFDTTSTSNDNPSCNPSCSSNDSDKNADSIITIRRPNIVCGINISPFGGYNTHSRKEIDAGDYNIVKALYEDHLRFVDGMDCHNYPFVAQLFFLMRIREADRHRRIYRLTLPELGASSLPRSILKLDALETLNLEKWTKGLPHWIGSLTSLKTLLVSVHDGQTLPDELGDLVNLQQLQIIGQTYVRLPASVRKLQNLEKLCLSVEHLPEEIGLLENLQSLHASSRIRSLPPSIGHLRHLQKLDLWAGKLKRLPDEIGNLQALEILNLESSCLESLPKSIGRLQSLKHLNLSRMKFLQALPDEIGHLTNLEDLDLCETVSEARQIPSSLVQLQKIRAIHLGKDFHENSNCNCNNCNNNHSNCNHKVLMRLAQECPSLGCLGYEKTVRYEKPVGTDQDSTKRSRIALAHVLMCNRINTLLFRRKNSNTTTTSSTTTASASLHSQNQNDEVVCGHEEILSKLSLWPHILEKSKRAMGPYKGWGWGSHCWGSGKGFHQQDAIYQLLVNYGAPVLEARTRVVVAFSTKKEEEDR